MKAMLIALLAGAFLETGAMASPVETAGCVLTDVQVKTVNLVITKKGTGTAKITCDGNGPGIAMTKDVSIDIAGFGPGLGFFQFTGLNVSLGIHNPYDLEGQYMVLNGDAAFAVGAGASFGLKSYEEGGLSFNLGVAGGTGVGVGLAATTWTFTVVD